jgi:hypothetical protein
MELQRAAEHLHLYNYHNFGLYLSSCILFKNTTFRRLDCLRIEVEATQMGPTEKASLCLRPATMSKFVTVINYMPSSQTYITYSSSAVSGVVMTKPMLGVLSISSA